MSNRLQYETSPYLRQHEENPVDWYPWGKEAFQKAVDEDKPIFLSIGYSTCHWCHVMAHECFEDEEVAALFNDSFVCIKVDREERPDIDSIYMTVCQAFTGSGGWPMSIFMTPQQKPFLAATYIPKQSRGRMVGLLELLPVIAEQWEKNRSVLLEQSSRILASLRRDTRSEGEADERLLAQAKDQYKRLYDAKNGGFGKAPKFPSPHNLWFLLSYCMRRKTDRCAGMVRHTLLQMMRGGLFDHIGGGFCRYSTDEQFLAPHFEKMLYDNALLILVYSRAYEQTGEDIFLQTARRTADYLLREMTSPEGGLYSAQDADIDGKEGEYYLFTPEEIISLLGEAAGEDFCRRYDITKQGNFEGKSIPNLLHTKIPEAASDSVLQTLWEYRKRRYFLHLDDKILTFWNALAIAALCELYRASRIPAYLDAAKRAQQFIEARLCEGDQLFVSYRNGERGVVGFLDDYAGYGFALLELNAATLEDVYLTRAKEMIHAAMSQFFDREQGGFYLYGEQNEQLILHPKETYDGALPSGNSLMAWNLVRFSQLSEDRELEIAAARQLDFIAADAARYPVGYGMFLLALTEWEYPADKVTVVLADEQERAKIPLLLPLDSVVTAVSPGAEYPLLNGKTTYYVCKNHACLPPSNQPPSR